MSGSNQRYLQAVESLNDSAITDVAFRYRIPSYPCPACGRSGIAFHLGYPHLDPAEVLTKEELRVIDGKGKQSAESAVWRGICQRLEDRWGVPVSGGAYFGPLRIKVSAKIKCDFECGAFSCECFLRRHAAITLQDAGYDFDFVDADAYGKYAREADFVQLVVPIIAHASVGSGYEYCPLCRTVGGTRERAGATWTLYDSPQLYRVPFFLPLEKNALILSAAFVEDARAIGVRGLVEGPPLKGGTLLPVQAVPDPEMSRASSPWPRLRDLRPPRSIHCKREASLRPRDNVHPPSWDLKEAHAWISRLHKFLDRVKAVGGSSDFQCGDSTTLEPRELANLPEPMSYLMQACGGRLRFNYALDLGGKKFGGGARLDFGSMKRDCKEWATNTWIVNEPETADMWLKAQPIFELQNGDFIALDCRKAGANSLVIYLSHDEAGDVLSPSLADFLMTWEELGYLGPEIWVLNEFVDAKTGFLSTESKAAHGIRGCLPVHPAS